MAEAAVKTATPGAEAERELTDGFHLLIDESRRRTADGKHGSIVPRASGRALPAACPAQDTFTKNYRLQQLGHEGTNNSAQTV